MFSIGLVMLKVNYIETVKNISFALISRNVPYFDDCTKICETFLIKSIFEALAMTSKCMA